MEGLSSGLVGCRQIGVGVGWCGVRYARSVGRYFLLSISSRERYLGVYLRIYRLGAAH